MSDDTASNLKPKPRRAWRLIAMTTAVLTLPMVGMFLLLDHLSALGEWIRGNLPWTALPLIAVSVVTLSTAVTPTLIVSALTGWCLGLAWGFPVAMTSIILSSIPAYIGARWFAGDSAMAIIREHPRWARIHAALLEQRFAREVWIITLLRLPPLAPFAFTNTAFAAMNVAWPSFLLGTLLGMAPRTMASVFIGAQMSAFDPKAGPPTWFTLAGGAVAFLVLVLVSVLARRELRRVT